MERDVGVCLCSANTGEGKEGLRVIMGSLDKDKSNISSLYILYCVIFSITTRLTIVSIPSHNFVLLSGTLALFLFSLTILYQFIYKSWCIDIIIAFHLYVSRNTIFISSNLPFIPF